jgi:sugar/nucleoside kinase (ribokinase family)
VVCIGLATLDTVFAVPSVPGPDARVVASEVVTAGGGPAATAAVALARLGVATAFVGAAGDDEAGAAIRDGLAAEGVDVEGVALVRGARSPCSTILVEQGSGSRTIVHHPGTAGPPVLGERDLARCRAAAWVHVDHAGYAAAPRDARLSVDGGNPIDGLDLHGVALYAPTELSLRERHGDPASAVRAGAELVVVTRGAGGSAAYTSEGLVAEAPGAPVEAVSTLGAGDVFHGALLAALVRGTPLPEALARANLAAALSCRALDGRSAVPTLAELDERSAAWPIASP